MTKRRDIQVISTLSCDGYSQSGDAWLHSKVDEEEVFKRKVSALVNRLIAKQDFTNVGNFYAESDMKQLNLIRYFRALFWLKPE
ncbi:hypothetical protein HGO21_03475 [Acinetobacter sp. CUI P1]|nr:hypothetical protein [Acinetobacter sp. CUI P1]